MIVAVTNMHIRENRLTDMGARVSGLEGCSIDSDIPNTRLVNQ